MKWVVLVESQSGPYGLPMDSMGIGLGLHRESQSSPCGVPMEFTGTSWGVYRESMGTGLGLYRDYRDSTGSPRESPGTRGGV